MQDRKNKEIICEKKTRHVVSYCCPYSRTESVEGKVVKKKEEAELNQRNKPVELDF